MVDLGPLLSDLRAESDELDKLVAPLPADKWATPTPAEGWTIANQITHLAWTDERAILAATDAEAFHAEIKGVTDAHNFVDEGAIKGSDAPPADLLDRWRASRDTLAKALAAVPAGTKLPWYGTPMSPASMVTARLMETWAHGQDVFDALGVTRAPTARLKHVAHIGVRARNYAYVINGKQVPAQEFRVELTAPDGSLWTWGPEDAEQRVTGPALDFCYLVTQRRHLTDTVLWSVGPDAAEWLTIAQAFAGPPGEGRQPRTPSEDS